MYGTHYIEKNGFLVEESGRKFGAIGGMFYFVGPFVHN